MRPPSKRDLASQEKELTAFVKESDKEKLDALLTTVCWRLCLHGCPDRVYPDLDKALADLKSHVSLHGHENATLETVRLTTEECGKLLDEYYEESGIQDLIQEMDTAVENLEKHE